MTLTKQQIRDRIRDNKKLIRRALAGIKKSTDPTKNAMRWEAVKLAKEAIAGYKEVLKGMPNG